MAMMIDHLTEAGSFAFDSEFIGERSYTPRLCLIQVATIRRVYIVDPMSGLDLMPLWERIVSPEVLKIVLAGQQDFGPAVAATGRPPRGVLDVQIAAGFIHADYPLSLVRLVREFVGVALGKGLTFTHWDNRPLSAVQMRYAADDVRYLPAAWDAISKRLTGLGRQDWAREECDEVLGDMSLYYTPPELLYRRVRGRDRLRSRQLAILRELAIVRDQAAREDDLPTRTLLKDSILVAMARYPAAKLADLAAIKGLPRPVEHKYGPGFVEATARALALPKEQLPSPEPKPPRRLGPADEAWAALGEFCAQRQIAPMLVSGSREIARAFRHAADGKPLDQLRLFSGWRGRLVGEMLRKLL
jgi:ribonuclease D